MIYLLIAIGIFLLDFGTKRYMDKKYTRNVPHPCLGGTIIIEKYYNKGAALNLLAKRPKLMRLLHTVILIIVGAFSYLVMKLTGKTLEKTGLALLLGEGLSNLYDRYAKGHVVDYFRINIGPKRFRKIVFNISDFCIFIGSLLAVIGAEYGK